MVMDDILCFLLFLCFGFVVLFCFVEFYGLAYPLYCH